MFCLFKASLPTLKGIGNLLKKPRDHNGSESIPDIPREGPGQGIQYK